MSSLHRINVSLYGQKPDRDALRVLRNYKTYEEDDPLIKTAMESLDVKYRHLIPVALESEICSDMTTIRAVALNNKDAIKGIKLANEAIQANPDKPKKLDKLLVKLSKKTGVPVDLIMMPFDSPRELYAMPTVETCDAGLNEVISVLEASILKSSRKQLIEVKELKDEVSERFSEISNRAAEIYLDLQEYDVKETHMLLRSPYDNPVENFEHIFSREECEQEMQVVERQDIIDMLSFLQSLDVSYFENSIEAEVEDLIVRSDAILHGDAPTSEEVMVIAGLANEGYLKIAVPYGDMFLEMDKVLDVAEEGFISNIGKAAKKAFLRLWAYIKGMIAKVRNLFYGKPDYSTGSSASSKKKSIKKKKGKFPKGFANSPKEVAEARSKNKKGTGSDSGSNKKKNKKKKKKFSKGGTTGGKNGTSSGSTAGKKKQKQSSSQSQSTHKKSRKQKQSTSKKKKQKKLFRVKRMDGQWDYIPAKDRSTSKTAYKMHYPEKANGTRNDRHLSGIDPGDKRMLIRLNGGYINSIGKVAKYLKEYSNEMMKEMTELFAQLKHGGDIRAPVIPQLNYGNEQSAVFKRMTKGGGLKLAKEDTMISLKTLDDTFGEYLTKNKTMVKLDIDKLTGYEAMDKFEKKHKGKITKLKGKVGNLTRNQEGLIHIFEKCLSVYDVACGKLYSMEGLRHKCMEKNLEQYINIENNSYVS